jgi:anaerobic magnesium-protoporphyrin IX monomethyl ester cyclase
MIEKIVLINPPLKSEDRYGKLASSGAVMPPLGLAILAAILRNNGYQVKIIDCEATRQNNNDVLKSINSWKPDVVGITAVTIAINKAAELAKQIKEMMTVPVIIGGVHISALPSETMKQNPQFDIDVLGEGEITLIELLAKINGNETINSVPKIIFRDHLQNIIQTKTRDLIENLDTLPLPTLDLLPNLKKYYHPSVFSFKRLPSFSFISSRGCPGVCTFCYHSLFGNSYRTHSADYVLDAVERLINEYGVRDIVFYDDTFTVDRSRVIEFCTGISKRNIKLSWSANARVTTVDYELLCLMKKSGCWKIGYGVETGEQRLLNAMKKGITLAQIERAFQWTKEAKLLAHGYFMIGNIDDTKETIEKTRKFILQLPMDLLTVGRFTPTPGSEDYKRAFSKGWFSNDLNKLSMHTIEYVPEGLTKEYLDRSIKTIVKEFYLNPRKLSHFIRLGLDPYKAPLLIKGGFGFLRLVFTK